jgi:hypothetical protein
LGSSELPTKAAGGGTSALPERRSADQHAAGVSVPAEAVLKLRTDYQTEKPNQPMRTETQRRRVKGASGYKHLKLGDD